MISHFTSLAIRLSVAALSNLSEISEIMVLVTKSLGTLISHQNNLGQHKSMLS